MALFEVVGAVVKHLADEHLALHLLFSRQIAFSHIGGGPEKVFDRSCQRA